MNEYLVTFKAKLKGLFQRSYEGTEAYSAASAKEAMQMCREHFTRTLSTHGVFVDSEDVEFKIIDVKKI